MKNNIQLVRIITPTYNRPDCMRFAAKSFIEQVNYVKTVKAPLTLEWVVCDQSPEKDSFMEQLALTRNDVHYIRTPSRAISAHEAPHLKYMLTPEQFDSPTAQRMLDYSNGGDSKVRREAENYRSRPNVSEVRNMSVAYETPLSVGLASNNIAIIHQDSDDIYLPTWPLHAANHLQTHDWGRPRLLTCYNMKNDTWSAYETGRVHEGKSIGIEFLIDEIGNATLRTPEEIRAEQMRPDNIGPDRAWYGLDYAWFGLSFVYTKEAWEKAGEINKARFNATINDNWVGGFLFTSRGEDCEMYIAAKAAGCRMGMIEEAALDLARVIGVGGSISHAQYLLPPDFVPDNMKKAANELKRALSVSFETQRHELRASGLRLGG